MKNYLKERFVELIDNVSDVHEFMCEIITEIEEWPEIDVEETNYEDDEIESYPESLDLENLSIIEITNDGIIICAGGDWQEPQKVKISLHNDQLVAKIIGEGFEDGLSDEEFLSEIFVEDFGDMDYDQIVEKLKEQE